MKLFLLIALLVPASLMAEETFTSYIIYLKNFSSSQVDAMKDYGNKKHAQPSLATYFLQAPNTNYAIITLSVNKQAEKDVLKSFKDLGKIRSYMKVGVWHDHIDVVNNENDPVNYVERPGDWDLDWSVWVSSK